MKRLGSSSSDFLLKNKHFHFLEKTDSPQRTRWGHEPLSRFKISAGPNGIEGNTRFLFVSRRGRGGTSATGQQEDSPLMHHRILPALLALSFVACGVEGSNTELTESTHAQGVQAKAVTTACSTPLSNGVKVTGISAELDAWSCTYTLEVPAGTGRLSFDMNQSSDGKGAAFMHVRFGAEPTFDTYDCRPGNLVGVNCTFLRPRAGTWYVKLSGAFGPSASGLELTGTYTLGIPSDSVLTNGVETARYLYKGSQWKCFTLDVPSGKSSVVFTERLTKTGWNIPPDLYVRYGEQPTKTAYDCSAYTDNGLATCTLNNPAAGTWFACSYGDYDRDGVVMKGTYP